MAEILEEQLGLVTKCCELTGSSKVCHVSHEMKHKCDIEGPTLGQKKLVHFQSVEKVKV